MRFIDLDTWSRKEHFNFFNGFDEPFWGVSLEVDCSKAYQLSRDTNTSFFLLYLHKSTVAANRVEEFRYRIDGQNRIVVHDTIGASSTINRPDGTFGFSYIEYAEDFKTFERYA